MVIGKSKIFNIGKKVVSGLAALSLASIITFSAKNSNSYETGTMENPSIHPLLVEKLAENYQPATGKFFDKYWIKSGSIKEDSPDNNYARAGNHFQHWQTGAGLTCPFDYCNAIKPHGSSDFLPLGNWIKNSQAQSTYPYGDHSWDRVKEDYRNGSIGEHFGYVFHLLSDLTVPAHVRNDVHASFLDKDDYEVWTDEHKNEIIYAVMGK